MRLCMFHPNDNPMERGWVGRLDGDRVLHLAAQTLQSFFLGGGGAREHAEYPLAEVTLLVPVQYPPTVRIFAADGSFRFANATAVIGPARTVEGSDADGTGSPRCGDRGGRGDRGQHGHAGVARPGRAARGQAVRLRPRARPDRRHTGRAGSGIRRVSAPGRRAGAWRASPVRSPGRRRSRSLPGARGSGPAS